MKREMDRDTLINVAKTSLRTKVHSKLADILTEVGSLLVLNRFHLASQQARWYSRTIAVFLCAPIWLPVFLLFSFPGTD